MSKYLQVKSISKNASITDINIASSKIKAPSTSFTNRKTNNVSKLEDSLRKEEMGKIYSNILANNNSTKLIKHNKIINLKKVEIFFGKQKTENRNTSQPLDTSIKQKDFPIKNPKLTSSNLNIKNSVKNSRNAITSNESKLISNKPINLTNKQNSSVNKNTTKENFSAFSFENIINSKKHINSKPKNSNSIEKDVNSYKNSNKKSPIYSKNFTTNKSQNISKSNLINRVSFKDIEFLKFDRENNMNTNSNVEDINSDYEFFATEDFVKAIHSDNNLKNSTAEDLNIVKIINDFEFTNNTSSNLTKTNTPKQSTILTGNLKNINLLDCDGPEELHFIHVNMFVQHKHLAVKFEKSDIKYKSRNENTSEEKQK